MVGGDHVIENLEAISLLGIKEPGQVALQVLGEFKQELLLVAPMGNVLDTARNVMSICAGHG